MMYCGTPYTIGAISPYLAAYFQVEMSKVQYLLPSIVFMQMMIMPIGGQLAKKCSPRLLMLIASSVDISCTVIASFVPRDSFWTFLVLYVSGQAICNGISYLVGLQVSW